MSKKRTQSAFKKRLHAIKRSLKKRSKRQLGRELLGVVGIILFIVVLLQVTYPVNRTLPFTKVADIEIGGLSKRDAVEYLFQSYGSVDLTVAFGNDSIKTTTDKAGVLVNFEKASDAAARYPLWQRLVPFSLFYKALVINAKPEISLDTHLAEQFSKELRAKCDKAVREAVVSVQNGNVVLANGENGRICHDKDIQEGLTLAVLRHRSATAKIAVTRLQPHKSTNLAAVQYKQAQDIITSKLALRVGETKTVVPQGVLAGWVRLIDVPEKGNYEVGLNEEAIRTYLEMLRAGVYIAPTQTYVHTLDGRETSRESGRPGRDIDYAKTMSLIRETLLGKSAATLIDAKLIDVPSPAVYLHNYSQSQGGLERLLADIVAQKGNYGITVTELSGMGRSASVNGDRKYVTASTYKLFIAYRVLRELEEGKLKWEDVITDGLNVRQCFEEMIVRSANRCALAYKARYGANNIVMQMRQLGLGSVEHNSTWWASPNDMMLYLKKLERGELLRDDSREFLLGLLKRQVWRYGIPTGLKGIQVADKVGFLEDYIHDLAIVYSPRGVYIIAIMTKGGSYGGMADVARRIENYLRQ